MKKYILPLLLIYALLLPPHAFALNEFVSSPQNNQSFNSHIDWSTYGTRPGNIIFESGQFRFWHTIIGPEIRIAYSSSINGLNWDTERLYDFNNSQIIIDPAITRTNNGYKLLYSSIDSNGAAKIYSIDSKDGLDFDKSTIKVVLIPSKDWSKNAITGSTLFYENGIYYLFYEGHNQHWSIGLATSTDGTNFENCINNPLLSNDVTANSLLKLSNTYYLFFHSPNGIEYMETDKLGCDSIWKNRTVALPYGFFPYVIQNGNELWMYYSTFENGTWKMNLAIAKLDEQTVGHKPIIFIPGLFASWNKEALLHNQPIPSTDWQLNPIVREYDGLTNTMYNLGYKRNTDYFVFPYDWRRPVEQSSDDLNKFISGLHLAEKPSLVGHSLGGLVGRIYAQKYNSSQIDKLVTVGTPHQGTALVYLAVEAGEADTRDQKMWLAEKLMLQLYRNGLETDKEIINKHFPVLQNLFPTYDFLKFDGESIPLNRLTVQNNLLPSYNQSLSSLYGQLQTIAGEGESTILGYTVSKQNVIDSLLNLYPDGKPTGPVYIPGDGTIITLSASAGNNTTTLNKNHGALVYSKEGIKTILQSLDIPVNDSKLVEGRGTAIFPSLLFLILSPAQIEVEGNESTYKEQDGMIFIENPAPGPYTVRAKGLAQGRYTIIVGQLTQNKDVWSRIEGKVTANPPTSQTDSYSFNFNPENLQSVTLMPEDMFLQLTLLLNDLNNPNSKKVMEFLSKAKTAYQNGKEEQVVAFLRQIGQILFQNFGTSIPEQKQKILQILDQIERLYGNLPQQRDPQALAASLKGLKNISSTTQNNLSKMAERGSSVTKQAYLLSVIQRKIQQVDEELAKRQYSYAEILIHDCRLLLQALP